MDCGQVEAPTLNFAIWANSSTAKLCIFIQLWSSLIPVPYVPSCWILFDSFPLPIRKQHRAANMVEHWPPWRAIWQSLIAANSQASDSPLGFCCISQQPKGYSSGTREAMGNKVMRWYDMIWHLLKSHVLLGMFRQEDSLALRCIDWVMRCLTASISCFVSFMKWQTHKIFRSHMEEEPG